MPLFRGIHRIAIIGSNYAQSKQFYIQILGFEVACETYRTERQSYKLDFIAIRCPQRRFEWIP